MPLRKESVFYEIFNISEPWEIIIMSLSKKLLCIEFKFDYNSDTLKCPICGINANVIGKGMYTWRYLDLLEYSTQITVFVPIVDNHNSGCKTSLDQTAISNLLLLDFIITLQKNTKIMNPLRYLFNAVNSESYKFSHSASSIAA
jgi:hypothetical protein